MLTRRKILAHSARLFTAAALSKTAPSLDAQPAPFKSASACSGMLVGIAADKAALQDPQVAQMVARNFSLITASGMKWDKVHPEQNRYDFSEGDWNMNFAQEHGLQVHGHNLCWNSAAGNPPWLKTLTKGNAKEVLTDHINTMMKRYQGRIGSWDVVNEPVVPWSKRPDGLYPGVWVDQLGPEYIDVAFHAAAAADPKALRIMNIHHVEQGDAGDETNRGKALELLKQLVSRGVPIDAVAFESHLDASQPLGGPPFRHFIEEIRALKLQVLITELDVTENRTSGGSEAWDKGTADYYGKYLGEVLPAANPRFVIFWTVNDRWEQGKRIQGLLQKDMTPRLNFSAALKALQSYHC